MSVNDKIKNLSQKLSIAGKGLQNKLTVIATLMFILPFLVFSYILNRENIFLQFEPLYMIMIGLVFLLAIAGLIILRKIFNEFLTLAVSIRKAEAGEFDAIEIKKSTSELYDISVTFNNLIKKLEDAAQQIGEQTYELKKETERRVHFEDELRESEKRYKSLIESVTDYIYTVKVEKGIAVSTIHGPGCEAVTGYTPEDFIADPHLWYRMIFEEDRDMVMEQAASILMGIVVQPVEHRIMYKSGNIRWVKNSPVPHYDDGGKLISYDGLIKDITEKKNLEVQLRHSQKMEALGQLSAGIAHDFNNILTAITGYAGILQMKIKEDSPLKHAVDHILVSVERAANLTQNLLSFARKQMTNLKPIRINETVARIGRLLSRIIGEEIELNIRLSEKDMVVSADSGQIEQVLMNLAGNARDAMPKGGLLSIATDFVEIDSSFLKAHGYGAPGSYALISVSDSGTGMDEETKKKIFEPFYTTKETGKGTGLGLAIVYGIIKQHNGYVNVYSEPGQGTTFKIYLQLVNSGAEVSRAAEQPPHSAGKETILLAEDEKDVREFTKGLLEDYGYTVIDASDGEEAVKRFTENKDSIQFLLFDLIMPKKNGKDAYHDIRKINPEIRALFMSGYTGEFIHQKGLAEENLNLLSKPVPPMELLRKIREVLDK